MRVRLESYDSLFDVMPKMGALMEKAGCECALPEYCFTNYLEPGYKDEDILVEICEAVTGAKQEIGGLYFRTLPEIQAACFFTGVPMAPCRNPMNPFSNTSKKTGMKSQEPFGKATLMGSGIRRRKAGG